MNPIILGLVTVFLSGSSTLVEPNSNIESLKLQEPVSAMIEQEQDSATYGGTYIKDGVVHLCVTDDVDNHAALTEQYNDLVIDKVKYSYQELEKASDMLWEANLGIKGIVIYNRTNSIKVVTSEQWTEEQKQAAKEMTGVYHIEFEKQTSELIDH